MCDRHIVGLIGIGTSDWADTSISGQLSKLSSVSESRPTSRPSSEVGLKRTISVSEGLTLVQEYIPGKYEGLKISMRRREWRNEFFCPWPHASVLHSYIRHQLEGCGDGADAVVGCESMDPLLNGSVRTETTSVS